MSFNNERIIFCISITSDNIGDRKSDMKEKNQATKLVMSFNGYSNSVIANIRTA